MAISSIGSSTGAFVPYMSARPHGDLSKYEVHHGGKIFHQIDIKYNKIDPNEYVKWCRRNLGERGQTWDFWLAGGMLYVEVWGEKEKFTYEMWKN